MLPERTDVLIVGGGIIGLTIARELLRAGRTDVVVLWSAGVVTGWQHVFRSEADATELEARVRHELARVRQDGGA